MSREEYIKVINEVLINKTIYATKISPKMRLNEDLGFDSLKKVQIICEVEEKLNIEIAISDVNPRNFETVENLYRIIGKTCNDLGIHKEWND